MGCSMKCNKERCPYCFTCFKQAPLKGTQSSAQWSDRGAVRIRALARDGAWSRSVVDKSAAVVEKLWSGGCGLRAVRLWKRQRNGGWEDEREGWLKLKT